MERENLSESQQTLIENLHLRFNQAKSEQDVEEMKDIFTEAEELGLQEALFGQILDDSFKEWSVLKEI